MARTLTSPRTPRTRKASRPRRTSSGSKSSRSTASRSPRNAPHQREVQAFLERFTLCMTSGDGDGVVHCFELPSLIVMSDPKYGPSQVLQEPEKVANFFAQAPDMYQEKGIATTIPDVESLEWLSDGVGIVTVRFPYIDADGNDLGDGERSLYVLRRDNNGELAICAAVTLGTDSDRLAGTGPGRLQRRTKKPRGEVGDQRAADSFSTPDGSSLT